MVQTDLSLRGRTAIVIGGTSGIGHAIALGLARAGASVVASGRREAQVSEVAKEIEALGGRTLKATVDVTIRSTVEALLAASVKEFQKVDILVNSAGQIRREPTLDSSEDSWWTILETNLLGVLRACQVFGRHMIEHRYGRIINITSLNAFVALKEVAAYAASKAAVQALTRSLAVEWAPYNVCVNAIAPGVFPTALNANLLQSGRGQELLSRTPMARFGDQEELVGAAVLLASGAASFMTGSSIVVDGGFLASGVNQ